MGDVVLWHRDFELQGAETQTLTGWLDLDSYRWIETRVKLTETRGPVQLRGLGLRHARPGARRLDEAGRAWEEAQHNFPGQRGELATMKTISVAVLEIFPSFTSNVNVSYPIAPAFGAYENAPVAGFVIVTVPSTLFTVAPLSLNAMFESKALCDVPPLPETVPLVKLKPETPVPSMPGAFGVFCTRMLLSDGLLVFVNPAVVSAMYMDAGVAHLKPPFGVNLATFSLESGQLVLFPSWVMHDVKPFEGEGARITIAFNCSFRLADPGQGAAASS